MSSTTPAITQSSATPESAARIAAEQHLASKLWPPVPGLEWVDDDGKHLTTLCHTTAEEQPEWMQRFRIDCVVSRPILLRWLHDEAERCPHAHAALNLLVDSSRHFDPPGYRNPDAVLQAVLAVLQGRKGV